MHSTRIRSVLYEKPGENRGGKKNAALSNASKNSFGGTCRSRMCGDRKLFNTDVGAAPRVDRGSSFKFKSQPSSLVSFREIYSPVCVRK